MNLNQLTFCEEVYLCTIKIRLALQGPTFLFSYSWTGVTGDGCQFLNCVFVVHFIKI